MHLQHHFEWNIDMFFGVWFKNYYCFFTTDHIIKIFQESIMCWQFSNCRLLSSNVEDLFLGYAWIIDDIFFLSNFFIRFRNMIYCFLVLNLTQIYLNFKAYKDLQITFFYKVNYLRFLMMTSAFLESKFKQLQAKKIMLVIYEFVAFFFCSVHFYIVCIFISWPLIWTWKSGFVKTL